MYNYYLRAEQKFADHIYRSCMPLHGDYGIVSFCFDDAPHSSCIAGRQILEEANCKGTWYVAGGLTNKMEQGHICHSVEDLQSLLSEGHQIACHGYSHKPFIELSESEIQNEIRSNAVFFDSLGLPTANLDFSFPLGQYNLSAKKIVSKHYRSMRMIGGGVQVGRVDLNGLQSYSLYQHGTIKERVLNLIEQTMTQRGWLIFYSHDVSVNPSRWGCTPELLGFAIESALKSNCKVLSIDQAIKYWSDQHFNLIK